MSGTRYVFNSEEGYEILGPYVGMDEGVVLYKPSTMGGIASAPEDCCVVREVTDPETHEEKKRLARQIEAAARWPGTTGFNSLVQAAVEIIEYAQTMGAELSVDQAYANLRREQKERYIGTRAHSRQFFEGEGKPHDSEAEALAARLALAVDADDEEALFAAEREILDRLGISPDETELGFTRRAVVRIEVWVSEQLGRPWTYGTKYGEPDAYAESDLSLRPRPGESAADVMARVEKAAKAG